MNVLDVLLALILGISAAYYLAGRDLLYVGNIAERRPLEWSGISALISRATAAITDRRGTWGRRNRGRLAVACAAGAAAVTAALASGGLGLPNAGLLLALLTLLPLAYYTLPVPPGEGIDLMLVDLIISLRAFLADDETTLTNAFRTVVEDGEGPVYEHMRQEIVYIAADRSFGTIMRSLAAYYQHNAFSQLAYLLAEHDGKESELDQNLAQLTDRLLLDEQRQIRESIARRRNLMFAVGVVFLMPAIFLVVLVPMLRNMTVMTY